MSKEDDYFIFFSQIFRVNMTLGFFIISGLALKETKISHFSSFFVSHYASKSIYNDRAPHDKSQKIKMSEEFSQIAYSSLTIPLKIYI